MDPTLSGRQAYRTEGRRKATIVTTVAVFVGAAAIGGVTVALASTTPGNDPSQTSVQPQDQLQPDDGLQAPARPPRAGSGGRSHGSSGAS